MQWSDEPNAGFTVVNNPYLPVIDDDTYGYRKVNVAAQEQDRESYLWATRFLLEARRQQLALQRGKMSILPVDHPSILAYWRYADDPENDNRLLCIYNLSNQQQSISLDLGQLSGRTMTDLLVSGEKLILSEWPTVLLLAPHASRWQRLD